MNTRRDFLKHSTLLALAPSVPAFLTSTARAASSRQDDRVLVVIQLDGGNDGINTVVPYRDEGYARHRDRLRLPNDQLIALNGDVALHPALRPAADLIDDGRLAIVQGVGYPNPNRSHDVSMSIWQTARLDRQEHNGFGWIGRAMDGSPKPLSGAPHSILVGDEKMPATLLGRKSVASAFCDPSELTLKHNAARVMNIVPDATDDLVSFVRRTSLDAYATSDLLSQEASRADRAARYPETHLAKRLSMIARLIKADLGTRIYYAIQPGYDTHALQLPAQNNLLGELAGGLQAFLNDLKASRVDDRVLVLCFSEFGRRVEENASQGTDHGTAGPILLAGPGVVPGPHGSTPSLTNLEEGDLKTSIDFRAVYATVLEQWLGIESGKILGGKFEPLPVLCCAARRS